MKRGSQTGSASWAWRAWWLAGAALLLSLGAAPVAAQSLAPVTTAPMPAIATGTDPHVLARMDGQVLAVAGRELWMLEPGGSAWEPRAWPPELSGLMAIGGAGDGRRAWLLLSASGTAIEKVVRIEVSAGGALALRNEPALPVRPAGALAAASAQALYVAGIDEAGGAKVYRLATEAPAARWQELAGLPSDARPDSLTTHGEAAFLTARLPDGSTRLYRGTLAEPWTDLGPVPGTVQAALAQPLGQANLVYLLREAAAPARFATYQLITGAWATLPGEAPQEVAASSAWPNGVLWAAPARAGQSEVASSEVEQRLMLLHWPDRIVIGLYIILMVWIGWFFYRREKTRSTASFFLGNRKIPVWAAGISLYAANTSSISFIAIPAKAFETNWQYLTNNLIAVVGLVFVSIWIVPLLRRLDLMSVFSYLETRFHPGIRMIASALAIITQIGSRMSIIMFLPAMAIAAITGIDVVWSVILMGGFTILYTAMGGMKAVIWTDVAQFVVMIGGSLFAIGFMIWHSGTGPAEFWHIASSSDKMKLFDFSFDLTKATVWGFVFLVLFDVVLTFPKDQVLMQRALATESDKAAGRSIWAFAAIMIPGGFMFYFLGTALFAYYQTHPERLNPTLPIDATFPLFIAAELPVGATGLIIAGIFAAAMSTLSGIMNSVATLASVDFYEKLARNPTPERSVRFAEIITVVTGLVGIGVALLLTRFDIHSLFDVSIELAGLLGGGFAGAYTLGMFTRRANAPGVIIGITSSVALTLVAWSFNLVHPYFYLAIAIFLTVVIGYAASLFFPPPTMPLEGLTIFTRRRPAS